MPHRCCRPVARLFPSRQASVFLCLGLVQFGLVTSGAAQSVSDEPRPIATDAAPIVTLSGEHRIRLEALDPQFRPGLGKNDQALSLRTILKVDVAWRKWSFVGELMDSRIELNGADSLLNTGNINAVEPVEFAATRTWANVFGSETAAVARFGRITADLGSRRLLGRHRYRNTTNSFVGLDWQWTGKDAQGLRALFLMPTPIRPRDRESLLGNAARVDDADRDQQLSVLQYSRPISGHGDRLESAWLGMTDTRAGAGRDLDTYSIRFLRPASSGGWFYDVEYMHQRGQSVDRSGQSVALISHAARSHHVEIGFGFAGPGAPAIALLSDYASGDESPGDGSNGRFDRLFGPVRPDFGPTGIYGPVVTRSNIDAVGIRLRSRPFPQWQATATLHRFRLAAERDAWVTTGLRDATGQSGDSVGRQLEVSFGWRPTGRRVRADAGLTRLAKGSFARLLAPDRAATSMYYYLGATIEF